MTVATPVKIPAPTAQTACATGTTNAQQAVLAVSHVPTPEKRPADAGVVVLVKMRAKIAAAAMPFRRLLCVFMVISLIWCLSVRLFMARRQNKEAILFGGQRAPIPFFWDTQNWYPSGS